MKTSLFKKRILIIWGITFSIYTFSYLYRTFVIWKFTNPFQWIVDLPNSTTDCRIGILFGIIFWYCLITVMVYDFTKPKKLSQ